MFDVERGNYLHFNPLSCCSYVYFVTVCETMPKSYYFLLRVAKVFIQYEMVIGSTY